MVPLNEDWVLSNTDYLMGAVMEARVNLPLGRHHKIFHLLHFFNVQFILFVLKKVQVKEISTFWLS